MSETTIVLNQRIGTICKSKDLILSLTANERKSLRGRRKTTCGQEILLQLPREGPLMDGEVLTGDQSSPLVLIKAAMESLFLVSAKTDLELIQASYHLGNRHIDLEIHNKKLFLLEDAVLAVMLKQRGLKVEKSKRAFFPELGAYSQALKSSQ